MYILILAPTSKRAGDIQAALDGAVGHASVTTSWPELFASLEERRPDLILVERGSLTHMEVATLLTLTESGRWPPLLILDPPAAGAGPAVEIVQQISRASPHHYQIGDLRIDTRKRRACLGERRVTLPPIQYRLLLALARRTGEVVNCRELLQTVWGYDADESEARELVKVHIRQIRRRLGLDPEKHNYIHSVRGFGYMLASPEEE